MNSTQEYVILNNEGTELKLIDTEKASSKPIDKVKAFDKTASELEGAKLLFMEPTIDGPGCTEVKGVTLYFILPDKSQRAINIYASELEPDQLCVYLHQ